MHSSNIRSPARVGPYLLLRKLAVGGTSSVYVGRHVGLGGDCAVKVLDPELSRSVDARRRFRREAVVLARLDDPGIPRSRGASLDEGYHYIAPSNLFARLPQGVVAGEVFADLLPAWTLARLPGSQVASGFAQLSPSGHWQFKADIQTVPHGKGRLMFHQFRMWEKLGSLALADALFANLADVVRELH